MFIAQTIKVAFFLKKGEKKNLCDAFQAGGMPSTHAAAVIGLTTALGMHSGIQTDAFLVSLIFSIIVLYDASGVRYTAGTHGKILNELTNNKYKLNELLGHTPLEVTIGSIIGLLTPLLLSIFL